MENSCSKVLEKAECSILWPDDEYYKFWEKRLVPSDYFIKDLSIDKVLDEVGFEGADREKIGLLFENPCTNEEVLQYRLDIMEDFSQNEVLVENFKEFVKTMAFIQNCTEEKLANIKGIHVQTYFFERAAAYVSLITGMRACLEEINENIRSSGLKKLLKYITHISEENAFKLMNEEIKKITKEYESVSGVYFEFGYYEGLKDIVISLEKTKKHIESEESWISQLITNGAAFLNGTDKRYCNIYYDARFSRLEEIVFERLQMKNPEVFESLKNFYDKYSEQDFEEICKLKVEAEFYIKFTQLIGQIEKHGLKFCKPVIGKDKRKDTKIEGLFDLSLAMQRLKDGKDMLSKEVVLNDVRFDEEGEFFVLTGPNKGGKTTYIRSIGIAQVFFQAGCFIPALMAEMSIADAVYTHFPEEEILGINKGRLGEEAERISVIINNSTSESLVLLNETFSSTRRIDGYYLGRDVLKIFMKIKCKGIYVTHFGELADEIEALNEKVPDGSKLASLVAGIVASDNTGLTGNRTFRIQRRKPDGLGYSRDIVFKHGLLPEQITLLLKKRGYVQE